MFLTLIPDLGNHFWKDHPVNFLPNCNSGTKLWLNGTKNHTKINRDKSGQKVLVVTGELLQLENLGLNPNSFTCCLSNLGQVSAWV